MPATSSHRSFALACVLTVCAAGCTDPPATDGSADTVDDGWDDNGCGLPGVSPESWDFALDAPAQGDPLRNDVVVAGCKYEANLITGHWTEVFRAGSNASDPVTCVTTWRFRSDRRADIGPCDLMLQPVTWRAPELHGSPHCEETLGYDPAEVLFDRFIGLGHDSGNGLCTLLADEDWRIDDSFLLEAENATGFRLTDEIFTTAIGR